MNNKKCVYCNKNYDIKFFINNGKELIRCKICRDEDNKKKEAVSKEKKYEYMKKYRKDKINKDKSIMVKKIEQNKWTKYDSPKDLMNKIDGFTNTMISKVLSGRCKQTNGYNIKYSNTHYLVNKEKIKIKSIEVIDTVNNEIYYYKNTSEAALDLGINISLIQRVIRGQNKKTGDYIISQKEIEFDLKITKCGKCNKFKDKKEFKDNKNRIMKKCKACRTEIKEKSSNKWKQDNKQRISDYNKLYREKKKGIQKTKKIIQARLSDGEWENFNSASDLAKKKNLKTPNISMVLNGKMNRTGGYEIRRNVIDLSNNEVKRQKILQNTNWTEIVEDKGYTTVKGSPSPNRIQHEIKDDVIGKKCCTCKKWKPLNSGYNNCSNHWDGFRVDCKKCISEYRKLDYVKFIKKKYNKEYWLKHKNKLKKDNKKWREENKEYYNEYMRKYKSVWEQRQRLINPQFAIKRNLMCRLYHSIKNDRMTEETQKYIGCNLNKLKSHIKKQFTNDMSWSNYGKKWHIDHYFPLESWDLSIPEQQFMCFNYRNLRPLDGIENIKKKDKFIPEEKEAYELLYSLEVNEINEQVQSFAT